MESRVLLLSQGVGSCPSHHILFLPRGSTPCRQQLVRAEQSLQAHPHWHQPVSSLHLHVQFHSFSDGAFP